MGIDVVEVRESVIRALSARHLHTEEEVAIALGRPGAALWACLDGWACASRGATERHLNDARYWMGLPPIRSGHSKAALDEMLAGVAEEALAQFVK